MFHFSSVGLVIQLFDLQGYKTKTNLIIGQSPLPDTKLDMWRLIGDFDCKTIVRLNPVSEEAQVRHTCRKIVQYILKAQQRVL